MEHHPDAVGLLVHTAQEVEEVAGQVGVATGQLGHPAPVAGVDRHGQGAVGDVRFDGVPQLRDQVVAQGVGIH